MIIKCRLAVLFIALCVASLTHAQIDSTARPRSKPLSRLLDQQAEDIDSNRLLKYDLNQINRKDSFHIKGLDRLFHQYDPARERLYDYGTLGNVGSAAYPTVLNMLRWKGLRLGYTQYDLYHKTLEDVIHFDQVRPFSELYFSGGETQSDLRVGALFSRTFSDDVNLVIDYDRISQIGIYANQAVKQTSFLSSLAYRGHKRFSAFFTYILNASVEEINGGVRDLATLSDPVNDIRQNVSVFSTDAESRLQNQSISFNAYYRLGADSIKSEFDNSIHYEVSSFNEFYRFSDASVATDSIFYKNFLISERGLRNFNEHRRIRNGIYLKSSFKDIYQFETGLRYDYNNVNLSSTSENINEIYLTFKGGLQVKKRLLIGVDFYYGLVGAANEFGLNANAQLRLTKNQGFNFNFIASRYRVNLIKEKLVLNEEVFYDLDIAPIILQTLKAEYYNDTWKLRLGAQIQNSFNFLYFDRLSLPSQDAGLYSASLLYGKYDLSYGKILVENSAYLQNQNKNHLNLPSFFTKNSISYYGKIFKNKMLLKAGLDFRYIVSQYLPYYNPVIGQFYLNDEVEYDAYPMVDARISFKVSSFTTFVKYENLTSFLVDDVEQLVQDYPQFDARFRFGILWNLWN